MQEKWKRAKAALKNFFLVSVPRGFRARWYYLLVALGAVAVDQVTKRIVVANMGLYDSVRVIPHVLDFTYITNDGAAWGMLDQHRWVFMVLSVLGIIAFSLYLFGKKKGDRWIDLGLALVIGGGVGNMIDRVFRGEVVDFLDATFMDVFGGFPIFNGADCFVCVGAAILLIALVTEMVREGKKEREPKNAPAQDAGDVSHPAVPQKGGEDTAPETVPQKGDEDTARVNASSKDSGDAEHETDGRD